MSNRQMKKKAAIELSTTFLVGLILGIIMLGMGLTFLYNIVAGGSKILEYGIPDGCNAFAAECSQKAGQVCIYETSLKLYTGKGGPFCLVINNLVGEEKIFKIRVTPATGILKNGDTIPASDIDISKWTFEDYGDIEIANNEFVKQSLSMQVPRSTRPGQYVFNVNVCYAGSGTDTAKCGSGTYKTLYDSTHQITVIVP